MEGFQLFGVVQPGFDCPAVNIYTAGFSTLTTGDIFVNRWVVADPSAGSVYLTTPTAAEFVAAAPDKTAGRSYIFHITVGDATTDVNIFSPDASVTMHGRLPATDQISIAPGDGLNFPVRPTLVRLTAVGSGSEAVDIY